MRHFVNTYYDGRLHIREDLSNLEEEEKMDISKMSKEDALKAIEDLKAYVEQCEEKEKEIPEMERKCLSTPQSAIICPSPDEAIKGSKVTSWLTFKEADTTTVWAILAYELAELLYCREYFDVNDEDVWRAKRHTLSVFCINYLSSENRYDIVEIKPGVDLRPNELVWCFDKEEEAERTRDYMNKYVKDIKKEMY